jgi:hypothetical protein
MKKSKYKEVDTIQFVATKISFGGTKNVSHGENLNEAIENGAIIDE